MEGGGRERKGRREEGEVATATLSAHLSLPETGEKGSRERRRENERGREEGATPQALHGSPHPHLTLSLPPVVSVHPAFRANALLIQKEPQVLCPALIRQGKTHPSLPSMSSLSPPWPSHVSGPLSHTLNYSGCEKSVILLFSRPPQR